MVLACGVPVGRDLPIPGRELDGIHFAMDYLPLQNKRCEGDAIKESQFITAKDKHVVIIGGGDTGADCLGTAHRQGAKSVHQLELLPKPPAIRAADNPWPQWPNIFRVSGAHEEGGERLYSVATSKFLGDDKGRVRALAGSSVQAVKEDGRLTFKPVPGTDFELPADLVLLAMGFTGAEGKGLVSDLGLAMTPRGTVQRDASWMTSVPGVFVTGDMQRGQSLIVWAIADGRSTARGVDTWLMGASELPAPGPVARPAARLRAPIQSPFTTPGGGHRCPAAHRGGVRRPARPRGRRDARTAGQRPNTTPVTSAAASDAATVCGVTAAQINASLRARITAVNANAPPRPSASPTTPRRAFPRTATSAPHVGADASCRQTATDSGATWTTARRFAAPGASTASRLVTVPIRRPSSSPRTFIDA